MSSHRKPPLPASMKVRPPPNGICRWCAQPILNSLGHPAYATWHPPCVEEFKLIHWPAVTRAAVLERDKGICARCGCDAERMRRRWVSADRYTWIRHLPPRAERRREQLIRAARNRLARMGKGWSGGAWQHDHIRPLVEAEGRIEFWQMANIQTLCSACHVAKGREDNRRRKQARALDGPLVQPSLW